MTTTAVDLEATRCCDYWPHDADECCLFSACDCCGGFFSVGPSTRPTCYVCSLGEATQPAGAFEEICRIGQPRPSDWDERPF